MRHRVDKLMKAKQILATLPTLPIEERETVSSEDAIALLSDVIGPLQEKGYSLDKIAKILQDSGVELTAALLARHLRRAPAAGQKPAPNAPTTAPPPAKRNRPSKAPPKAGEPAAAPAPEPEKKSSGFTVRGDTDQL